MKKNNPYKATQSILLALAVCFIVVFSSSIISALEFDNIKSYDYQTRTATFKNSFLGIPTTDIATVTLLTPLNIRVGIGYQKVAEMRVDGFTNYNDILKQMNFYDMKNGKIKINRDYDLKWKTTEIIEVVDYNKTCNYIWDESIELEVQECESVEIGSHEETVEVWKKLTPVDIKENDIMILGIFTDVKYGDYIDWIPELFGVTVDEWATWTADLNVNLTHYLEFNEQDTTGAGKIIDKIGEDATNVGATNFSGILGTSYHFGGNNHINSSANQTGYSELTLSFWMNVNSVPVTQNVMSSLETVPTTNGIFIYNSFASGNTVYLLYINGTQALIQKPTQGTNAWHHYIISYDGSNMKLYVDNSLLDTQPLTGTFETTAVNFTFGSIGSISFDGELDEIAIWNRALNTTEIDLIYNNSNGLSFVSFDLEVVLNSPENNSREIINTDIIFNATAISKKGNTLLNMSLYIDGILNETKSLSGLEDTEIFNKSFSELKIYNWSIMACDNESECTTSEVININVNNFITNSVLLNLSSYETATETFSINVSGEATSASLFYEGIEYTTTKSGTTFNRTIQIPYGEVGNNSVYWRFNDIENSDTYYQNVSETILLLCNATYTTTFLNISFKDESDLSIINASIPTSTFEYWLGDGTVTKTYTLINNTDNFNYELCAIPTDRTLNVDSLIQYKQGSNYPQRIFSQTGATLTSTVTDLVLYLLEVSDGLFVTFQVFGGQSNAIEGVDVSGTRVLDGADQLVAQGTTDAAGIVTFWLNPDFLHTFTYTKTGLETVIESIFPTQVLYTVTMGGDTADTVVDDAEGIKINTLPQGSFLDSNTFYTFTYYINSSVLELDEYGFELFYNNGTSMYSDSGTVSAGGTLDKSINTTNESRILMTYYYITNGTTITGSTYWLVYQTNDFSIYHLFNRVSTYIDYNVYGILGDDNGYFSKAMISILILILVTGTLSMRYGLSSDAAVTGLIFGVVMMLNIFNLIPTPDLLEFINLGDFLTFIIALFVIVSIIKEEGR